MTQAEGACDTSWVPKVDMEFTSDDDAYNFYNNYAKLVGFSVRKAWINRRASGVIISRTYVCYKEGYQGNKKDEFEVTKPRKNERTGCLAHMIIKITENRKYRISEFHPMHNHDLVPIKNANILKSHRSAKRPRIIVGNPALQKATIEYLVRQAGGYKQVTFSSVEDATGQSWAPKVDMEFESDEKACEFYTEYGRKVGFDVRKAWVTRKPHASGIIISRTIVCYKEGFYGNRKDGSQVEKHRLKSSERTGCLARMIIKLAKNGRYRVSEFEPNHNHDLVTARTAHMLKSYREAAKVKTVGNMVGRVTLKASPECVGEHLRSIQCKNNMPVNDHVPVARKIGDVGAIMEYMQAKQADDKSFYYAIQLDDEDHVRNVFWADGKSMVDYYHFSDVICFDMTYRTSSYGRPFAPFYGVNHHRKIVFFGSALIYDDSEESFKWLLQTFEGAMFGKQPRVILTDRNEAIYNAIASVWQGTTYRTCVWHVYHNATKYLSQVFQGSRTFANDFGSCVFDCEEEEGFVASWEKILEKYDLKDNVWLKQWFDEREKWAVPFGRETFCADMKSVQRRENLSRMLKEHLDLEQDLMQFFKHYESIIDEHRQAEVRADFHVTQITSLMASSRMLRQAANAYTPPVFDIFQREFEMSLDCLLYRCGDVGAIYEYKVTSDDNPKEQLVKFDYLNCMITCSCNKFEFIGIQCRHVLKTLDILNIKELPARYLLKRWRKDAKVGYLRVDQGFASDVDPNSSKTQRYSSLRRIFSIIAARAAHTVEGCTLIENQSDQLMENIYHILKTRLPEEHQFH